MHMRSKRNSSRHGPVLVGLVCIILVAALLAGCGGSSSGGGSSSSASPSGDQPILRIGAFPYWFTAMQPFTSGGTPDSFGFQQMYPALVQFPEGKTVAPDLAESWETSADGLTWTFKLRSGAVWSDGKPITAKDAAFMINTAARLQTGAAAALGIYLGGAKQATAQDDTTLVVTLQAPNAAFLSSICFLPILPEHVWAPLAEGDGAKLKTKSLDPAKGPLVVAGPFTIQKLDTRGTTLFKRVDTYYGPKPLITGFGMQVFTNGDAIIQALKSGQVDAANMLSGTTAPLESDKAFTLQSFGTFAQTLAVNYSAGNKVHPELHNVKVREAISLALDREQAMQTAFGGAAQPGGSCLIPQYVPTFMSAQVPAVGRDVAKANQLLDDLGFAKGSDGIRVADGVKMSYTLLIPSYAASYASREADVFSQNMKEVGIEIKPKLVDNLLAAIFGPNGDYAGFDMSLIDFGAQPDPNLGLQCYTSAMLGVYNWNGYSNPKYDKLWSQQVSEMDTANRKAIIDQMSALLTQDQVEIPLLYHGFPTAWNPQWQEVPTAGGLGGWPDYFSRDVFTKLWLKK